VSVLVSIIQKGLVHNELEWTWKEVVTACQKYYCNICLKEQRKANEYLSC